MKIKKEMPAVGQFNIGRVGESLGVGESKQDKHHINSNDG